MKIVKKEIPAVHYEEITYDEIGETDGKYAIGDKIKAINIKGFTEVSGIITKIVVVDYKSIHQIQVNNGWWVHPIEWYGNDEVIILEKFNKK